MGKKCKELKENTVTFIMQSLLLKKQIEFYRIDAYLEIVLVFIALGTKNKNINRLQTTNKFLFVFFFFSIFHYRGVSRFTSPLCRNIH